MIISGQKSGTLAEARRNKDVACRERRGGVHGGRGAAAADQHGHQADGLGAQEAHGRHGLLQTQASGLEHSPGRGRTRTRTAAENRALDTGTLAETAIISDTPPVAEGASGKWRLTLNPIHDPKT